MFSKQLNKIASKIADPDIPDREPDKVDELGIGSRIWDLGGGHRFEIIGDGSKFWSLNGKFHREDGPAAIYSYGKKEWWLNGELHREDGPAIESADIKRWYLNGKLHREDGPAVISRIGPEEWWKNGKRHREDGPAIEYGDRNNKWYLNDKKIIVRNCDSPEFKKRWKKLLELEKIRQVMED